VAAEEGGRVECWPWAGKRCCVYAEFPAAAEAAKASGLREVGVYSRGPGGPAFAVQFVGEPAAVAAVVQAFQGRRFEGAGGARRCGGCWVAAGGRQRGRRGPARLLAQEPR
jgi:hypothetical protein